MGESRSSYAPTSVICRASSMGLKSVRVGARAPRFLGSVGFGRFDRSISGPLVRFSRDRFCGSCQGASCGASLQSVATEEADLGKQVARRANQKFEAEDSAQN